jgi:hypothetical protein
MAKHVVNVPEYATSSRRMMTANQWLAEFAVRDAREKSRVLIFADPVRVSYLEPLDDKPRVLVCRTSPTLFSLLERLAYAGGILRAVSWRGHSLDAHGLFALNKANQTAAVRKGGLNIVRHWLENKTGTTVPLRGDFLALLSYLEIRPVSRVKTGKNDSSTSTPDSAPAASTAIHYVSSRIRHNDKDLRGGKRRSHA